MILLRITFYIALLGVEIMLNVVRLGVALLNVIVPILGSVLLQKIWHLQLPRVAGIKIGCVFYPIIFMLCT